MLPINNSVLPPEAFYYILSSTDPRTILNATEVCKDWNECIEIAGNGIWREVSIAEGIPLVSCKSKTGNYQARNYKEDFKILHSVMGVSGKSIANIFGKVIGKIPEISVERYNELFEPDPWEPTKLKKDTFVFVVDICLVQRTLKGTELVLNGSGNLISGESTEEVSTILLSLKNIKMLSTCPLIGAENGRVFGSFNPNILNQCDTSPESNGVYFMRREVPEETRTEDYPTQKGIVRREGYEVTCLRIRTLFDTVMILESGTCPDGENPWTYARTSDVMQLNGRSYQTAIGGFALRVGVHVCYSYYDDDDIIGVVPGGPAEVLPAIGP